MPLQQVDEKQLQKETKRYVPYTSGYRDLTGFKGRTAKAVLALYYDWELWFPLKTLRWEETDRGIRWCVPAALLKSAKDHAIGADDEFQAETIRRSQSRGKAKEGPPS